MFFKNTKYKYLRYDLEQRWQSLGIKQWINKNPKLVFAIAAISFLLFVVIAISLLTPDKPPVPQENKMAWFYDLNTKQLFKAKNSKLPPIKAPSGPTPDGSPAGVRAYVFGTDYSNASEPLIAFLETFTPDGKEAQKEYDPKKHDSKLWAQGRLFKRPNDPNWTPANTPRGIAIYQEFFFKNNNTEPTPKDSILQH